jgi:hypothetical protein
VAWTWGNWQRRWREYIERDFVSLKRMIKRWKFLETKVV